jgi:serine phosphatase RsbU (regulator of sigma subunit)
MVLTKAGPSYGSQDRRLEIITGIAHQAALAIQNDRLQQERVGRERLEQELQLAREIQQTFIPTETPDLPGWEVAATWRAAREVAGDFYDYFALPGGRLGLIIADVADKGMPAALFMTLTRTLVRAVALEEMAPDLVLMRVNDLLEPDALHGMFVTAFYAVLAPESGELVYANAGHNLPLLLKSSGEVVYLERGGMALGVLEGVSLEQNTIRLNPGDSVIFFTDGVTEAFSAGEEYYGDERLLQVVRGYGGESVRGLVEAIELSVIEFVGEAPASDDLTLLVIRREVES